MKIFVGCSSSDEIAREYMQDSKHLLEEIFSLKIDLVFGANNTGLMGMAYDTAKEHGRDVIGICPEIYKDDFQKLQCTKEIIARTVSERTEMVISESDVLLFLPGGIGTMFELLTAIESKRGHEHDKLIIIFNSNNYFDKLLETFDKIYSEKFTSSKVSKNYIVCNSSEEVINILKTIEGN